MSLIVASIGTAVLVFPQAALAAAECFFPGGACNYSWISSGSDANGSYSTVWTQAHVFKQTTGHLSRITMIDTSGNWHGSNADTNLVTPSGVEPATYSKKGYCKNIDTGGYTAKCTIGG
jgi:hypothetical protein